LSLARGAAALAAIMIAACAPGPAPFVARPAGGQNVVITVINESPRPALLVVAEVTEDGLAGRQVGVASPGVVPAGATVDVVFSLPSGDAWAIFINAGRNRGPILGPAELAKVKNLQVFEDGSPGAQMCDGPVSGECEGQ
jgi:hypothetical protein